MIQLEKKTRQRKSVMQNGLKIIKYDCIGSTNAEAKRYAAESDSREPVLFLAKEQSAGRGRLGRSFYSRLSGGIYMSLLYFTDSPLADAVSVTTAAAVFVAEAIEGVAGKKMKIKWVNDIYNEHGKVAGILAETLSVGDKTAVVIGIGINTGKDDFPEELHGIASSIGEVDEAARERIVLAIAESLLAHAKNPSDIGYMAGYRQRFMLEGVTVDLLSAGEIIAHGKVLGVSDDGGLVFLKEGESASEIIRTGEVSVRV